jgi:hypothetical protein
VNHPEQYPPETKRWESFTRFLESGAIPLENNAAELGDLCYPINKRTKGRLHGELNELCNRLEYLEATGDGELDLF